MRLTFLSAISSGSKSGILQLAINSLSATARVLIVIVGLLYSQAAFAQSGARAWGRNDAGQLGNGTFTNSTTPVTVTGLDGLSAISAGGSHNLALMSDGTVRAWGMNNSGQLGNGTTINSATPLTVSGLSGVVAIAAGNTHNLVLLADGTVKAWGNNTAGQLGDGTTINRTTPVAVSGLSGVVAIAGGDLHSLALLSDGTIKAWGYNFYGQLGDATTTTRTTPVTVNGITGAASIATGAFHSLALLSNGTVKAWGRGDVGQLGNGATTNQTTPVFVSGLGSAVSIAAGDVHSLALLSNGTVWGWGWNFFGQLGDGTITDRTAPVAASGISGATAIAAGLAHTLARLNDGTVKAWGYNVSGQLGDGTITARTTPVTVSGLNGAATVTAGNFYSLALLTTTAPTDLFITNSDSPDPVLAGDNITYTLIITNNGPNPAPSAIVTDTLPGGLTFVSSSTSQGSCAGTSGVTCGLGTLAGWASATVMIVAGTTVPGTITNTATVTSAAPDPNSENNSATTATTVNADATKPVIIPTVTPPPNFNGWNNTNVTVNWSVSDPESGIASSSGCTTTVLTTDTSATTLTCSATNGSGLSHLASVTIKIDKSSPVITPNLTPVPNGAGWNTGTVNVAWSVTDPQSGVVSSTGCNSSAQSTETSGLTLTCAATNWADSSNSASVILKVDLSAPVIVPGVAPPPNAAGWNNTDVTVGFTFGDPVSGIASASPGCGGATFTSETLGTTLTCSVVNGAGLTAAVPVTVRIDKTKPLVSNVVVNPNPAPVNTALTVTANVNGPSPGASPIISAEFNIDDGPFGALVPASGGTFDKTSYAMTAAVSPFAMPGLHSLCARSADTAGNVSDLSCVLFAIYGPNDGFVSGAGWIQSPLGAYAANPTLGGKAQFGFVSKYLPGAHVPSGETHFQFKTADLNFDSTSYDWLVVAGARAQFKGSGTINGSGDYMFLLTAIDGQRPGGRETDKFRIKIIDKNGGSVVYDNQMGKDDNGNDATELGGGSIVIHN